MYDEIRRELTEYYFGDLPDTAERIRREVYAKMDEYAADNPDASAYRLKAKLYDVIADAIEPKIFDSLPFFFDTGALVAPSDGRYRHGPHILHANGWLYLYKLHLFEELDPEMHALYSLDKRDILYAQTGVYVDIMHVGLPLKKVISVGLSGILAELEEAKSIAAEDSLEFFDTAISGILALKKIAERFATAARAAGREELARLASRIPWEAPKTLCEGLAAMAFMRRAFGSIEGVGLNSFGRVDRLLLPLYEADRERGVSDTEQLDIISKFLLIWDAALDRREKLESGAGYELENTLTLGGTDECGEPVWNGLTRLFLDARDNLNLLYPKMMLRFSSRSPREYMERIAEPITKGKSQSLLENDDVTLPALVKSGISESDAVDYVVGGCWDLLTMNKGVRFSGEYFNILRVLDWAIQGKCEKFCEHKLNYLSLEDSESFEELYERYLKMLGELAYRKAHPMSLGARVWHRVNPLPTLSALMDSCIPRGRDVTNGGGEYNFEQMYFTNFAEVADSLLAIKHLCFDKKICTLRELFTECRENWTNEILRQRAISAPSYGDGGEESSRFAGRLFDDLYRLSRGLPTAFGGEFRVGYNQYTEIIFWGKCTGALPNGRRDGEFLSAGVTPSRIQRPITVSEMIDSMRYMDTKKCAANSSLTLTLPAGRIDAPLLADLLYALAKSPVQAIQPNCVSVETLRAAQAEPEKFGHVIVRVCGFSAPFVLLSPTYQEEFISRMATEL